MKQLIVTIEGKTFDTVDELVDFLYDNKIEKDFVKGITETHTGKVNKYTLCYISEVKPC